MKRTIRILALPLALLTALLFAGCAASAPRDEMAGSSMTNGYYDGGDYAAKDSFDDAMLDSNTAGSFTDTMEVAPAEEGLYSRKLIYTLDLSLRSDDPAAALDALAQKAQSLGGYVSDSTAYTDDLGVYNAYVTLRVPPEYLGDVESLAKTLGRVTDNHLYTDEITDEYWDIYARLESAQAQEAQLLELLKQCQTVDETLQVRSALGDVQSEIEVYQGRLRLWDKQVGYSTVNISIYRTPTIPVDSEEDLLRIWKLQDVWKNMKNGFLNTAHFLVNAFYGIFIALSYAILPLMLLAIPVVVIILCVRHSRRKKAKASKTQEKKD